MWPQQLSSAVIECNPVRNPRIIETLSTTTADNATLANSNFAQTLSGGGGCDDHLAISLDFELHDGGGSNFPVKQPYGNQHHPSIDQSRDRELLELRARCVQLEKTVCWWSDCTASWREKWSVVRDDRNRTRLELRCLKATLADAERKLDEFTSSRFLEIPADPSIVKVDATSSSTFNDSPQPVETKKEHWQQLEKDNLKLKSQLNALMDRIPSSLWKTLGLDYVVERDGVLSPTNESSSRHTSKSSTPRSSDSEDEQRRENYDLIRVGDNESGDVSLTANSSSHRNGHRFRTDKMDRFSC